MHASLKGLGSALPERVITSQELESLYGLEKGWINKRTGIASRHVGEMHETASTLGTAAAHNAIQSAGIKTEDIDTVIVSTCTPDLIAPATACLIAEKLSLRGVAAFDISTACSGWMYAVNIANSMIKANTARTILVVAAEVMSKIVDWNDTDTSVLFGDGAGAAIICSSDRPGIVSITTSSDSTKGGILYATNAIRGQTKNYESPTLVLENGPAVFKNSTEIMATALTNEMHQNKLSIDDIDWLVLHQANSRIIDTIAKKVSCPAEKVLKTILFHGNTSSASVPILLDHFIKNNTIQPQQKILLGAFGSGFTWATGLFIS